MHSAVVFIDGNEVGRHEGGYLPFEVDLSPWLAEGEERTLSIELDNRDAPSVPPGKPLDELDFCWYGGLYREVSLRFYPSLRITNSITANRVAGGGVFLRTIAVGEDEAVVIAKVHVENACIEDSDFGIRVLMRSPSGKSSVAFLAKCKVAAGENAHFEVGLEIPNPELWSPRSPHLYAVEIQLFSGDDELLDERHERFGIRVIEMSRSGGLMLNGERIRPRGTNRHQDFPRVGYALPDVAQYRDAKRIKEAGFDYVRLSHYPQSPAFLDACDELGILVMNCIPGWQFIGDERFREASYRNARELIRRDRNHASVILWELSLNETHMDEAFMKRLHEIGHEEYPGDQMHTCGWIDAYDVYLHSRQHGRIHTWVNGDKPLVVAEYGDWEFYAANEGFDQKADQRLLEEWANSRSFRGDGERKLRRQTKNHMIALNDTMCSPAICDGQWSFCDYPRGYHPVRAACGIMDFFRLPKFSYYFYQSQRSIDEAGNDNANTAMVFIASHWTAASDLEILVFSNGDEVELFLDGRSLGRMGPSSVWFTQALPHPPFIFQLEAYRAGKLEAVAYYNGSAVARHSVATPRSPTGIRLEIDDAGVQAGPDESDTVVAHARIVDAAATLCVDARFDVTFSLEGDVEILGDRVVPTEAGIASVVLRREAGSYGGTIRCACDGFESQELVWQPRTDKGAKLNGIRVSSERIVSENLYQ